MIFLGAGSSKIFGIKTLQDMTGDLIEKMRERGYNETIDNIIKKLNTFNLAPDFESIYTILEGLANPEESIKNSGPFTAYVCKDLKEIEPQNFQKLLYDFKRFIYEECRLKPQVNKKLKSVFDKLFKTLEHRREKHYFTTVMDNFNSPPSVNINDTIVTTNYDMAIELYHRSIRKELIDGFDKTPDPYIQEMNPRIYGKFPDERWLIKLHGSIWQFKQGNRIIKTIADPDNSPIPISIDEEMMIYPTGEKPMLKNPYFTFYEIFKHQQWTRMVTIGYSFRDDPINIAITENLEKVKNSTLIVVNPEAEKVIKNLGFLGKMYNNRIIRISEPLSDKEVLFKKIDLAIKVNTWKRYQERLWHDFKEKITH